MIERDIILVDMDDTLAGFYNGSTASISPPDRVSRTEFYSEHNYPPELHGSIESTYLAPGFHRSLEPLPDIHHGWHTLIENGFKPRIASAPNLNNPTCIEDKIGWVEDNMVSAFGHSVIDEMIIDKEKWKYPALALIDDRPTVAKGPNGNHVATWEHVLYGWENLPVVPLADTAFRLIRWSDIDSIIPTLNSLRNTKG